VSQMALPSSLSVDVSVGVPLLAPKLYIPRVRPDCVPRPRLFDQLDQGLTGRLVLVSGPAGYGKTTLVTQWLASRPYPVAWVSLDAGDNDPVRFLRYVVGALQTIMPGVGQTLQLLLQTPQLLSIESVLTVLINELCGYQQADDRADHPCRLVLDDYHLVDAQPIHHVVTFLVDNMPPQMRLIIATRVDPPLPLSRWRSRGQMTEIRADDLRFTFEETTEFFGRVMGLDLSSDEVATLEERTEGWIVGLQMAALSMHGRRDVSQFVQSFTGSHRYVLDYLVEEILNHQPQDVQTFLLRTSILKRLSGPLCDAVLEQTGSQAILEELEKANLFLVPLDDERCSYRYHHLFADLLRARLDQRCPGLASQLHARAAAWLEQEGSTVEAVNHALAAGAHDHAARLVEENTTRLLAQGELNALMGWIETLPVELRLARPWLCVHQAYALIFGGRPAEVEPLLIQVEAALGAVSEQGTASLTGQVDRTDTRSMDVAETRALKGALAAVRAFTNVAMGQDAQAVSQAQQARELLPAGNLWDRAAAAWALGYTRFTQGRLPEARLAFEEQIRLGRSMGNTWTLLAGLTYLAQVLQAQGQLPQARALLEDAVAEASRQGARSRGYIALVEASLASVLCEQNELEAASRLLAEAITHTDQWPNPNHIIYAYALQARVLLAQGDLQRAQTSIGEADKIGKSTALARGVRRTVEAELVRVWLAFQAAGISLIPGDPLAERSSALVASWRSELASPAESADPPMDGYAEMAALALIHASLTDGQAEEALTLLEPITRSARSAGHIEAAIRSLALTALAWQGKSVGLAPKAGRSDPAFTALEEALSLAEPGGYVRVFLDEGQSMRLLLAQWLAYASAGSLRDYAIRLLAHFDAEPHVIAAAQEIASPAGDPSTSYVVSLIEPSGQALVEPLSERELEVLRLVADGLSNREIADALILAVGTVKAHVHNIYGKLDVQSRTQAVARAREIKLL
jgi:LuxR family maltose regulon positive regulatory protein